MANKNLGNLLRRFEGNQRKREGMSMEGSEGPMIKS